MPLDYQPMTYVAGVLGLRWSEVAGLRVGRVDFLRRTVTVAETLAGVNGRPHVADVKTKAARRTLGMPPELAELLAAHLSRRARPAPQEYVFVAPNGGPMRPSNFRQRVWQPAAARAGLDGLTFHGLRHSAVGLMIELGAHVEAIKQRMGHSSIRVTSDVYGSVLPSVDEAVTAGLGDVMRRPRGTGVVQSGDA
jgi:integrase